MIEQGFYLADRAVAERAGVLESSYVTQDGRFILDSQALKFIRLTPGEYVTGIEGIERISYEEAQSLIAAGGYKHLVDVEQENAQTEAGRADSGEAEKETSEDNNENDKEE